MGRHIARLEQYVSTMSQLHRLEVTRPELRSTPLSPLAASLAESGKMVCTQAGKGFSMENRTASPRLALDGAFVAQVFGNLVANAARYAGINDKRNIVLSMAIAGALSGAGAALYFLSGNTEFYWHTYQTLPATGFNGIPVALLASCSPIGCIFSGMFMAYLTISGSQLSTFTAYNEYITDVIIATIVYLSAFSLVIKLWLSGRKKRKAQAAAAPVPAPAGDGKAEKGGEDA